MNGQALFLLLVLAIPLPCRPEPFLPARVTAPNGIRLESLSEDGFHPVKGSALARAGERLRATVAVKVVLPSALGDLRLVEDSEQLSYSCRWTFTNGRLIAESQKVSQNELSVVGHFSQAGTQYISAAVTATAKAEYVPSKSKRSSVVSMGAVGKFDTKVHVRRPPHFYIVGIPLAVRAGGEIALSAYEPQDHRGKAVASKWSIIKDESGACFREKHQGASTSVTLSSRERGTVLVEARHGGDPSKTARIRLAFVDIAGLRTDHSMLFAGGIADDLGGHQTAVRARVSAQRSGVPVFFRVHPDTPFGLRHASLSTDLGASEQREAIAATDSNGEAVVYVTTSDCLGELAVSASLSRDWASARHSVRVKQVGFDRVSAVPDD